MTCRKVFPLIDDYADNCLDESLKESVTAHIDSCKKCESKFNETNRLKTLLQSLSVPYPGIMYFNQATDLILSRIANDSRTHEGVH